MYTSKVISIQHYHCNIIDGNHGNGTQPNNYIKIFKKHRVNGPLITLLSSMYASISAKYLFNNELFFWRFFFLLQMFFFQRIRFFSWYFVEHIFWLSESSEKCVLYMFTYIYIHISIHTLCTYVYIKHAWRNNPKYSTLMHTLYL